MLWSIAAVSASCARSGSNLIQSSSILIHAFRATPSWSPSEWQSPTGAAAGLNCQQHRNRTTFTSNVMGEYRSKRISDHFTYMRKLKVWRGQMASQLAIWRGGFRKVQFEQWEEKRKQEVISTAADAANHAHRLAEKQHEELMETIRKVTNEHAVAELRLERAIKEEKRVEDREQGIALRRAILLEASRDWVGPEELDARIEEALDNPSPFGFISKQPRTTGF